MQSIEGRHQQPGVAAEGSHERLTMVLDLQHGGPRLGLRQGDPGQGTQNGAEGLDAVTPPDAVDGIGEARTAQRRSPEHHLDLFLDGASRVVRPHVSPMGRFWRGDVTGKAIGLSIKRPAQDHEPPGGTAPTKNVTKILTIT